MEKLDGAPGIRRLEIGLAQSRERRRFGFRDEGRPERALRLRSL
jgi:hypothetical protein